MIELQHYPLRSLREGSWFKLICGASFQHLPAIRNLVLAYTLAGADCIDVAADPAVISVAKTALDIAADLGSKAHELGFAYRGTPWLMVSLNDGEDPHFRKAEFRAELCPSDCLRPCELICPAQAIDCSGVISDRCYGCGRCLPVCPIQHITTRAYVSTPAAIAPLIIQSGVDAIEIHTQVGRTDDFKRLWKAISPWVHDLKLIAVSCPDGEGLIEYLRSLHQIMTPLPCALVWQTDGRPMSGDIGIGATRAAIKLGQKVLGAELPGYVQLAGGTNYHTVAKLRTLGLLQAGFATNSQYSSARYIAGIAYGSYARSLLSPILNQLEAMQSAALGTSHLSPSTHIQPSHSGDLSPISSMTSTDSTQPCPFFLEEVPDLLWQAVDLASSLVSQLKSTSINPINLLSTS